MSIVGERKSAVNGSFARLASGVARLGRDRSGNFGIMTALLLPVLLGASGVALDTLNLTLAKTNLQAAADSASLAAATALAQGKTTEEQAKKLAEDFLVGHAGQTAGDIIPDKLTTSVDIGTRVNSYGAKEYDVRVNARSEIRLNPMMALLGLEIAHVSVVSETASEELLKNALSMYLVLDKSGSMQASTETVKSQTSGCNRYVMLFGSLFNLGKRTPCMYTQMEVLQIAANKLFDGFDKNDKDGKYIRVGVVSYDSEDQDPTPLAFDRKPARSYVDELEPEGGTASTGAFRTAYDALMAKEDGNAHEKKNGLKPKKYILFMTDGANNYERDNNDTLALCKKARDAGITVYAVAFNAPTTAKTFLRNCASSEKTFYDAQDADALQKAFEAIGKNTSGAPARLTG